MSLTDLSDVVILPLMPDISNLPIFLELLFTQGLIAPGVLQLLLEDPSFCRTG